MCYIMFYIFALKVSSKTVPHIKLSGKEKGNVKIYTKLKTKMCVCVRPAGLLGHRLIHLLRRPTEKLCCMPVCDLVFKTRDVQ